MDCPICMEALKENEKDIIDCSKCVYRYHKECLSKWFRTCSNKKCTICKHNIEMQLLDYSTLDKFFVVLERIFAILVVFTFYALVTNIWKIVFYYLFKNFGNLVALYENYIFMIVEFTFQVVVGSRVISYIIIYSLIYNDMQFENVFEDIEHNVRNYINTEIMIFSFQVMISVFYMSEKLLAIMINRLYT